MMKCSFCGHSFDETACKNGRNGCSGCPMSKSCKKIKCPNCNYEMYPEPEIKIFDIIKGWGKRLCRK